MRPGFFTTMTTGSKGSLYALLQQALPRECLQPAIGMGAEGSPPSAAQADMGQAGREASGEPSQVHLRTPDACLTPDGVEYIRYAATAASTCLRAPLCAC